MLYQQQLPLGAMGYHTYCKVLKVSTEIATPRFFFRSPRPVSSIPRRWGNLKNIFEKAWLLILVVMMIEECWLAIYICTFLAIFVYICTILAMRLWTVLMSHNSLYIYLSWKCNLALNCTYNSHHFVIFCIYNVSANPAQENFLHKW